MNQAQIENWIAIAGAVEQLGMSLAGRVQDFWHFLHQGSEPPLTDEEINTIEAAIVADAEKRAAVRAEMGKPSE